MENANTPNAAKNASCPLHEMASAPETTVWLIALAAGLLALAGWVLLK
jgi:hypothetical protein